MTARISFGELITVVAEYAQEYGITPADAIYDLEVDGFDGDYRDAARLSRHFSELGLLYKEYV